MTLPIQESLQLLLLDFSDTYEDVLSEVLRPNWQNVDIAHIIVLGALNTALKSSWDAIIVSYGMARQAINALQAAECHIPVFILCESADEDEAFALMDEGVSYIVPSKRLSVSHVCCAANRN